VLGSLLWIASLLTAPGLLSSFTHNGTDAPYNAWAATSLSLVAAVFSGAVKSHLASRERYIPLNSSEKFYFQSLWSFMLEGKDLLWDTQV
jgi:hypothetical protein